MHALSAKRRRARRIQISGTQIITTAYAGAIEVQTLAPHKTACGSSAGVTATQRITKTYYSAGAQLIAMRVYTSPTSSVLYFLHSDHLGSTSLTTDSSGNVVARQLYDAWGNVRVKGDLKTDITFTGQRSNLDQIGLYYFKARFYASSLGRFVSADTLVPSASDPQQLNRYAYGLNNPLRYLDPSGHGACESADSTTCRPDAADIARRFLQILIRQAQATFGITFAGTGWDSTRVAAVVNAAGHIDQQLRSTVTADARSAAILAGTRAARQRGESTTSLRQLGMFDLGALGEGGVFQAVFGPVVFRHVNQDPGYWGFTHTDNGEIIDVYKGAFAQNADFTFHFPAHELGHAFAHRTGGTDGQPRVPYDDLAAANLGLFDPGRPWRQRRAEDTFAREYFADMFLGWAYNHLEDRRMNWMNASMPRWMALTITENQ